MNNRYRFPLLLTILFSRMPLHCKYVVDSHTHCTFLSMYEMLRCMLFVQYRADRISLESLPVKKKRFSFTLQCVGIQYCNYCDEYRNHFTANLWSN